MALPSSRVTQEPLPILYCTSTYMVASEAVIVILDVAEPLEQLPNDVVADTDPVVQLDASMVIDDSDVVPLSGSRRFSVVYSAYHEIITLALLACPGTLRLVFVEPELTDVPVVKLVELPPLTV